MGAKKGKSLLGLELAVFESKYKIAPHFAIVSGCADTVKFGHYIRPSQVFCGYFQVPWIARSVDEFRPAYFPNPIGNFCSIIGNKFKLSHAVHINALLGQNARAMSVAVRMRILQGAHQVSSFLKPFTRETTVEDVVEKMLSANPDYKVQFLELFPTAQEKRDGLYTQLDSSDFGAFSLENVSELGLFWVAHLLPPDGFRTPAARITNSSSQAQSSGSHAASDESPSEMVNSLGTLMEHERGKALLLPARSLNSNFDKRIFNALIDDLRSLCLGFHYADAQGSGQALLSALSKALAYVIPFDLNGALARRNTHIPDRFGSDHLKVSDEHDWDGERVGCGG